MAKRFEWNKDVFDDKKKPPAVEVYTLPDGQVYEHNGSLYIKCDDRTGGVRKAVALESDGSTAIVNHYGYTVVNPLPFMARIVVEPMEVRAAK